MKNIKYLLVLFLMLIAQINFGQDFWRNLNGPFGGTVLELKKQVNGDLVTVRNDGLFRSADNGNSWLRMNEGSVNTNLSMDISQSGIIYTGKSTGGLWWTANSGQSWNFNPISVAPHSGTWASVVIVKVNSLGHVYINNHVSLNGGQNFTAFDYNGVNLISRDYAFNNLNQVYSATQNGVFHSVNNGTSWQSINGNLPSVNSTSLMFDGNTLIAGISGAGIYKTTDNGIAWNPINSGISDLNINRIYKDAQNIYFAGTSTGKLFRSNDMGNTWTLIYESNSENRINSIYSDYSNGNSVFISTSFGIFKTVNNGNSWTAENNNLNIPVINSLAFPGSDKIMAATGTGIYYSGDNGMNWERRDNNLPTVNSVILFRTSNGDILTGLRNSGIYRSSDNGITWQQSGQGLPSAGYFKQITGSPNGSIFALYTSSLSGDSLKLYRSSDNGNSWTKILQPELNSFANIGISGSGKIYLVSLLSFPSKMLTSEDNGNSWVETELTQFFFPDKFAVSGNDIYIVSSGEIFRSSDSGNNWDPIPGGGWQSSFMSAFKLNSRGDIFVSQGLSVYFTTNNGQTWSMENSGLTQNSEITDIAFDNLNYVYALTYYFGIFKSLLPTITNISMNETEVPGNFSLSQNFPNPFNPRTVINFELGNTNDISIKVYDILGNEMDILVNEKLNAGNYSVEFDGSYFASGIYFYTMETENFRDTRRMILLK